MGLKLLCYTLFDFYANVVARKRGKMITHFFWFKNLSLDEEI
jgi:predicted DNA-binding protein YlxM (UPF0122 family)